MKNPLLVLCLTAAVPSLVWARPTGISGFSGQATKTCNNCHSGGAEPTVTIEGPDELELGQAAEFTVAITGGAGQSGGLGVSTGDAGVNLISGEGTKIVNSELTHSAPARFPDAGTLRFSFTVLATGEGPATIFAAGLSADGNLLKTNDRAGATSKALLVRGPDANTELPPEGGSDPLVDGVRVGQGCSSAGMLSAPVAALLVLGQLLRRRRS